MKQLITRTQFAKRAGVGRSAITQLSAAGKALAPANVDGKVDVGHPAAIKYLKKKGVDPTFTPDVEPEQHEVAGVSDDGTAETMVHVGRMTLDEIGERFGGVDAFESWQKRLKTKEEIREKRLKNEETEGAVISREFVKTHIFGLLEELSRRLLSDASRTITRRTYASAQAGLGLEEAEAVVREIIGTNLERAKTRTKKKLNEA